MVRKYKSVQEIVRCFRLEREDQRPNTETKEREEHEEASSGPATNETDLLPKKMGTKNLELEEIIEPKIEEK